MRIALVTLAALLANLQAAEGWIAGSPIAFMGSPRSKVGASCTPMLRFRVGGGALRQAGMGRRPSTYMQVSVGQEGETKYTARFKEMIGRVGAYTELEIAGDETDRSRLHHGGFAHSGNVQHAWNALQRCRSRMQKRSELWLLGFRNAGGSRHTAHCLNGQVHRDAVETCLSHHLQFLILCKFAPFLQSTPPALEE